jgi:hypothetical protein
MEFVSRRQVGGYAGPARTGKNLFQAFELLLALATLAAAIREQIGDVTGQALALLGRLDASPAGRRLV